MHAHTCMCVYTHIQLRSSYWVQSLLVGKGQKPSEAKSGNRLRDHLGVKGNLMDVYRPDKKKRQDSGEAEWEIQDLRLYLPPLRGHTISLISAAFCLLSMCLVQHGSRPQIYIRNIHLEVLQTDYILLGLLVQIPIRHIVHKLMRNGS